MNKKIIFKKIDKANIISFDVFDTLIRRAVNRPADIMDIVEKYYNNTSIEKIENFRKIRFDSEKEIRIETSKEITIEQIYEFIEKKYRIDKSVCNELMELEKKIEIEMCFYNYDIDDIIMYCINNKKKIILTTDMYLDIDTIEEIISKTPLKGVDILLSSKIGLKKSDGNLFAHILKKYNTKPNTILHIGDNLKSDFLMPKKYGIKSVLYRHKVKNNKNYNNFIDLLLEKKDENYYYKFGYKYMGPLLLGFCRFINEEVKKNKNNKIIFLAREGQLIKKCYDILYPNSNTEYMYISRKSASSSIILNNNVDLNKIIDIQSIALNETIFMFLKRFNLDTEKNMAFLKKNSINKNDNYERNKEFIKNNFSVLINNSEIKEDLFNKYLQQLKIDNNSSIVDVGWSGTMQDLICMEIPDNSIFGYYLGVRKQRKTEYKKGFIFDGNDEVMEINSRAMVALIEILFSANHGTTLRYKLNNEHVDPVLDAIDSNNYDQNIIRTIQNGLFDFMKESKKIYILPYLFNDNKDYYTNIINFGMNPTTKDIKMFSKIEVFNEKKKLLIGGKFFAFYLFNIKRFKSDFMDSGWKIAFLKNVLKINLNYGKIYRFLYNMKK